MIGDFDYDEALKENARAYLMRHFEGSAGQEPDTDLTDAAMHILCGKTWPQPTMAEVDLVKETEYAYGRRQPEWVAKKQ